MKYKGGALKWCPAITPLPTRLVHGGIVWARNSGIRLPKELQIWIRLMEPADAEEIDLEPFGDHGRPLEIGDKNGSIDVWVLQEPLALDAEDLPEETLARIGDIKAALVDYSSRPEYRQAAEDALVEQYGPDWESRKNVDWTDLIDKLLLEEFAFRRQIDCPAVCGELFRDNERRCASSGSGMA